MGVKKEVEDSRNKICIGSKRRRDSVCDSYVIVIYIYIYIYVLILWVFRDLILDEDFSLFLIIFLWINGKIQLPVMWRAKCFPSIVIEIPIQGLKEQGNKYSWCSHRKFSFYFFKKYFLVRSGIKLNHRISSFQYEIYLKSNPIH